jgi:aspartate racemase
MMKRIGIIGGIGPDSTLDYYRGIIEVFRKRDAGFNYPDIIVFSANLAELMGFLGGGQWDNLTDWLVDKVMALHSAGAEFGAIAANTPHIVFDKVRAKSPIPMISIVEASCQKAKGFGLKRLGLMGTKFTMASDLFLKPFQDHGMSVVVPEPEEQVFIHNKIVSELEFGKLTESTKEAFLSIVKGMMERDGIDGLILGCTEIPLILTHDEFGIPFLNTTQLHVESIVEYCVGQ